MSECSLAKSCADFIKKLSYSGYGRRNVAFKDDDNKRWIIYDSGTDKALVLPFGEVVTTVINTAVTLSPSNPNYETDLANYRKNGFSEEFLQAVIQKTNSPQFREGINAVRRWLLSMLKIGAEYSPADFECIVFNLWYKYAGIYDFENWAEYFSDVNETDLAGFPDTSAYRAYSSFDAAFGGRCVEVVGFAWIIDGKSVTGRVFLLDPLLDMGGLFPMDLLYLLKNSSSVHLCPRCGQLYLNDNLSSRYCPQCKSEVGKQGIINENRKKNKARYLHKRILDKLNSPANTTGVNSADFRAESNFYWSRIQGKQPKIIPKVANPKTRTEEEYIAWLESILPNPYVILKDRYSKD